MSNGVAVPIENSFTVYAQTNRSGFFGLTELEAFMRRNVEPYAGAGTTSTIIMDFSAVKMWDIAALLWMVVGLNHLRRDSGLTFRLRLPEGRNGMSTEDKDALDRSADYLRRWRFDRALQHIDLDVSRLLVPVQASFFSEPKRFYRERKVVDDSNLWQSLTSRRLTEIKSLSDPSLTGSAPISPEKISQCIRQFQTERIGDILVTQCSIEKRKADLFADHLLTEALLNVQEHPNATIGLISISLMGNTGDLVLSVVDNGDSIPATIFSRFKADHPGGGLPDTYRRQELSNDQIGTITSYATLPGVTSKPIGPPDNIGMGLTYIKEDTLKAFGGRLTIVTEGIKLLFTPDGDGPTRTDWPHGWKGNLLRITIPVARERAPRQNRQT